MKALVYVGPGEQEYRDVSDPVPGDGEAMIQVAYTGICGSDMHGFLGHDARRPAPLILGHEVAGEVVSGRFSGRRVAVNPLVTCGQCDVCRQGRDNLCSQRQIISMPPREGGFAEFLAIPESNLVFVPEHVRDAQAALTEPISCGWHAARLARKALSVDLQDARVLVIGGGAIGLGTALSLAAQGASGIRLVEPNALRAGYLRDRCNIDVVCSAESYAGTGFDLVIDSVGYAATRALACEKVRPGGVIVHIGLGAAEEGLDIRRMTLQEITFIGTYTYTAKDFRDTAEAMFQGKLGALDWVDIRPLSQGLVAFSDLRSGSVAAPKILLEPDTKGDVHV